MQRLSLSIYTAIALYTLYVLVGFNVPFFQRIVQSLPFNSINDGVIFVSLGVIVLSLFGLFHFIVLQRYIVKPIAIVLLWSNAAALYYANQFQIIIDVDMMTNVFETDLRETLDLLNPTLFAYLIVLAGLPSLIILKVQLTYPPVWKGIILRSGLIFVLLSVGLSTVFWQYKNFSTWLRLNRNVQNQMIPRNYLLGSYLAIKKQFTLARVTLPIDVDATVNIPTTNPLVVVMVGETARARNFGVYGYSRSTNPRLSTMDDLIVLKDVQSCGTSTAISVPCMFSFQSRQEHSNRENDYQSLPSLLQSLGIKAVYRGNNFGSCKKICNGIPSEYTQNTPIAEYCNDSECADGILLDGLKEKFDQLSDQPSLVILHQNGSHGPRYNKRYPTDFEKFAPVCDQSNITDCDQKSLINAYDNTIVYTDHNIAETIHMVDRLNRSAVVMYLSDHGESLGENGLYLHGLPYMLAPSEQKHVPWVVWTSTEFQALQKVNKPCLENLNGISHDYLFHTIAGLFGIQSSQYQKNLDLFNLCR